MGHMVYLLLYIQAVDTYTYYIHMYFNWKMYFVQGCGSGSFLHKKTPVILNFGKLSKIQFSKNIFLSLILSVIRCLDLVIKCQKQFFYFATHKKTYLSRIRIRLDLVFLGRPVSKENLPDPQHCFEHRFIFIQPNIMYQSPSAIRVKESGDGVMGLDSTS